MFKNVTITGIALAGAVAASGASAHESYGHSHYSSSPTYSTTYTAPTINLGPIEQVQPYGTTQYVQPTTTYIQPATTSTYSAPVNSYTTPSYAAQTYTPAYTAPSYTTPAYGTTYTTPSYVQPSYVQPSYGTVYTQPRYYDGTAKIQQRLDRQRSRIRNAADRGDLRKGERRKLRRKMRQIREQFRAYKANDGIIDQAEHAALNEQLSRQSRRIRRLGNNNRVAGPLVSPYGHNNYTRY